MIGLGIRRRPKVTARSGGVEGGVWGGLAEWVMDRMSKRRVAVECSGFRDRPKDGKQGPEAGGSGRKRGAIGGRPIALPIGSSLPVMRPINRLWQAVLTGGPRGPLVDISACQS